jgi:hypothetical protein
MKQIQQNDLSYLAGFIDADGSLIAQIVENKTYKLKYSIRLTIQITQTTRHHWFLLKIRNLIGAGYVRDRKDVSDYVLCQIANVANLLKQIQPFLILKEKQANLVLKIIEQLPSSKGSQDKFLELCQLVDQVALLNGGKSRKHTADTVSTFFRSQILSDL